MCAVYVEEQYRNQGIAGEMLQYICDDFLSRNIDTLYLVTEHTDFYERYDWKFLDMVQEEGDNHMTRMYCHVSSTCKKEFSIQVRKPNMDEI